MKNISNLTDKDLLALCQKYGTQAILWKRKFIGLLPEVDRRGLYLKKRCSSIYEFAAKFGGVTKKHTQRVIQIDKTFEENGLLRPSDCPKSVRPNTFTEGVALKKLRLNLSEEVLEELLELQGQGIDIDVLLRKFLQKRKEEIAERKEKVVKEVVEREGKRREEDKEPLRYISVKTKRILEEEYGAKCAVGGCEKEATQIHHTVPFSIGKSNSPDLLKPLCRAHHDIVHSINAAYVEKKGMG